MLWALADQLVPSETTGVRRMPVRKQIGKFNGMDGGKHRETLISASLARFLLDSARPKGFIRGLASCFCVHARQQLRHDQKQWDLINYKGDGRMSLH